MFRKRMTSYIRPVEDHSSKTTSKRASDQNENPSKVDKKLHDSMKDRNLVKQLYFSLLKRDGTNLGKKNDSNSMPEESGSNSYKLVKELYFDLLKRDSSNKSQSQDNTSQNDKMLMAKDLYFNLLKRNVNSQLSIQDLIRLSGSRNPEKIAKLKEYFYKLLVENLKTGYSDPEKLKKLLNKNGNVHLVKDLYFDLLKRKRNVDPKLTGSQILRLLKAKNSKLNKNLGMVKDLYFKLLKRSSSSNEQTETNNILEQNDDSRTKDDMTKELYFDLLKRNTDQNISKPDLLKLIKMKMTKFPNWDQNFSMLKDLYFKLLKRNSPSKAPILSETQTSVNDNVPEVSDRFERKAKELYFSLLKRNENTTKNDSTSLVESNDMKSEKMNKNLGLIKDLYFNLLKRANNKKDAVDTNQVHIPYSNYPHLQGKPDVAKHLFFNFFD